MLFVIVEEVFPHNLDEQFTNTCLHILAIWCVERDNLSVSISSSVLSIAIMIIGH